MKIYKNKIFQIHNLKQVDILKEKFPDQNIMLIHPYRFLAIQGPLIAKILNQYISKTKMIYIADVFTNVGLSIILMDLNIKNLSISSNLNKELTKKIQSLADVRGVNIYFTEKLKFVSL
tara:strand:+ start:253 stop:609 length:357 start_codon:yes stop_codon:yes gene_type:complete